jgi:hypothetical protein
MTTKMLLAAAVLAAMIASPAVAQTTGQRAPGAQQLPDQSLGRGTSPGRLQPLAEDIQTDGRRHSSNPANDVYVGGKYLGSDPDPNIRLDLRRDIEPTGN